jgi:hypothetical protein
VNTCGGRHLGGGGRAFPTLEELREIAAWWFDNTQAWALRHVETIDIESDRGAQVHLTADIELPRDLAASVPWDGPERLFMVPVAVVSKEPRPSHVDVFDERATRVQLFTREDNAKISVAALEKAAVTVLKDVPRPLTHADAERVAALKEMLKKLTLGNGWEAKFYAGLAVAQLKELVSTVGETPAGEHLFGLIEDLMASSMLWVPMIGVPGQPRSVRLEYHIAFHVSPLLWNLWHRFRLINIPIELQHMGAFELLQRPLDTNTRGTLRRIWNRVAHTAGFSAYGLRLEKPYVRRTFSYHLQVKAPVGVDVRHVRFLGLVSWPDGETGRINKATTTTHGHLYFSKAERIAPGAMSIQLRVGGRGLLFFSALTSMLIATMLWFFASAPDATLGQKSVTAQILLFAPALLIIFAFRQGEHPLVARLLSGVRLLVVLSGVCSVAAAAAIVGVRPFGEVRGPEWRSVGVNWHYEAVVATIVAGLLIVAWLLALQPMETVRNVTRVFCEDGRRYARLVAALIAAQLMLAAVIPDPEGLSLLERVGLALLIFGLGAFAGWIAGYGEVTDRKLSDLPATVLTISAIFSLGASLAYYGLDDHLMNWSRMHASYELCLALLVAVAVLYAALFRGERERNEDPERPSSLGGIVDAQPGEAGG